MEQHIDNYLYGINSNYIIIINMIIIIYIAGLVIMKYRVIKSLLIINERNAIVSIRNNRNRVELKQYWILAKSNGG